jgi:hypothetical protein
VSAVLQGGTYVGGAVRRRFLIGTRVGDTLASRYWQLNRTATPRQGPASPVSRPTQLAGSAGRRHGRGKGTSEVVASAEP